MVTPKKRFYVVAYDIADDHRRYKAVKILEKIGTRINYSVFECMLTQSQYLDLIDKLSNVFDRREDSIIFYPVCRRCYTQIKYLNKRPPKALDAIVVV